MHLKNLTDNPAVPPPETDVTVKELPWNQGRPPLLLAPMQGLTNRALRSLFIDWVRPDTVFTEFMRVSHNAQRKHLSAVDLREVAEQSEVPLVAQLIGHGADALVAAARSAQEAGARHINLNLGCPFGRMASGLSGGNMLRDPGSLRQIIPALRAAITGTFSVKLRAGYDNPRQIFDLLPLLEDAGADFLVLHPRTVVQKYAGFADHRITAEVAQRCPIPLIANGDIRTAAGGLRVLAETGATGLMLGRGAISDPLLFLRLRGEAPLDPDQAERTAMIARYLREALERYSCLFHGEAQTLARIRDIIATINQPHLERKLLRLKKARSIESFRAGLDELE